MSSFIRVTPKEGETFKDLTKRVSLPYHQGSGYYKLIKSESISTNKDLVLKKETGEWIAGGTAVRSELGLGSGKIAVKPTDLPASFELFVQSTSPNRKLTSGHDALFRLSVDLAIGNVTVSTSTSQKAKAGKRKRGDNDDADDGGDDERDGSNNQIVVWPSLIFTLTKEVECLDENELVVGADASNVPGDCDLPVPNHLVQQAIEIVNNEAVRAVAEWKQTERLIVPVREKRPLGSLPQVRYQWRSSRGGLRLMYVQCDSTTFVALEIPAKKWGLVCGNCGAHPFVHSPQFLYANSDGSSSDRDLPQGHITPATVLAKLIHDTALHCSNVEH